MAGDCAIVRAIESDCPKLVAMEAASSSKTALKSGAGRESSRSTNSASPIHMRQTPNDEQSSRPNLRLSSSYLWHCFCSA